MALLNRWPMQDNAASTTVVETVASNNGATLSANTSVASITGPGGLYPRALDVAGSLARSIRIANVAIASTPTVSLAGWIRFSSVTPAQCAVEISQNYNFNYGGVVYLEPFLSGQITVAVKGSGYNGKVYTASPVTGTWLHWALIWDFTQPGGTPAREAKLFVDGVEPAVANDSSLNSNNTGNFQNQPLFFGSRNQSSVPASAAYAGWHLYDHALSSTEIAALIAEIRPQRRRRAAQASIRSTF